MRQPFLNALRPAVSLVLIAMLVYMMRDSLPSMATALRRLSPFYFTAGVALYFLGVTIMSYRLKILLDSRGMAISFLYAVKLIFIGHFFSCFLPTSVGGDIVKAFYVARSSGRNIPSYTSVFIDRFIGMFAIFLIATVALFLAGDVAQYSLRRQLLLLVGLIVIFTILIFSRRTARLLSSLFMPIMPSRLKNGLKKVYDAINDYKDCKLEIAACFLLSIVAQLIAFSAVYVFGLGLKTALPLRLIFLAMPVASIVSMLPSINGIGPREMSIVVMLAPYTGKDIALALAFLWLCSIFIASLAGGLINISMGRRSLSVADLRRAYND